MSKKNRVIYASQAHTICRQWKEDSGWSLSEIVERIKSSSDVEVDPSNVSRWMGKGKEQARLIPEKHAYALYMHPHWSLPQGSTKQVDPQDPWGMNRLRQDIEDLENKKGGLLSFPFFQYSRSCIAVRPMIAALERDKKISQDRLLAILKQSEADAFSKEETTHLDLRELVEEAEQAHVLVDGDPLRLRFTKARKAFLRNLFSLWVFEDSAWSQEFKGRRKPENLRKLLIHLLEVGK